ncbi:ABC-F family ATP-binding cassette domain-containing protein [Alkalitalea saponilacus]|uniref:Probable ATP-binding protein YbiT n=1 Tax=Alkalitalea saponilacus TaxID=889453 RepID=A0A1T5HSW9_9BACT|nr:ABC-F family ATP-binding cassette domain-containing protein [Alkalitalea saponilacus]ASB50985.1 glycosyl transferase family 2 [Alkalitalea saponilacus]SKC23785.1 ATP-binding cassette, subfamily F, member 3 [Alkalitalea saponilacus]
MISVNQLTVDFGGFRLFDEVSFLINNRDRIGLVGKNGAGKSTLLKIIADQLVPSAGSVAKPKELTIGYLPQHIDYSDTQTVREETEQAFSELIHLENEIERLTKQVSQRTDYESAEYFELINKLTLQNERFAMLDGHNFHSQIEVTLKGLGFKQSDLDRPTREFSGGWRMRIELAKILLKKPDVFLLDEPTNHLDIESIQWLEDYLKSYAGALVLISHDRAFLDNITNRTVEISLGKMYDYKVSYSRFVELRHERREQQMAAYRNQQKKIEDTEAFIERFRYKATKAVQVQSRIKQLEKLERIEVDEFDGSALRIQFPPAPHSGSITIKGKGITKYYDQLHVLDDLDFVIERGEKVAFVGKNGEGKTTMARIILNEIEYGGSIELGHQVKIGYFAQNQADQLDNSLTVLETVDRVAVGDIRTKIRDLLGAFLFSGEDVDKKVSVLSGGERTRLAMVLLLLEPVNLLILDEPTNHLDMRSKELLKKALADFNGTVILVSHDRDFLNGLVNKTYEFTNRKIKEHLGGIYEFLEKKKLESLKELESRPSIAKSASSSEMETSKGKLSFEERKDLNRRIKKTATEAEQSEKRVEDLEDQLTKMDALLQNPDKNDDLSHIYTDYEKVKKELDEEMERWEKLNYELEKLETEKCELE